MRTIKVLAILGLAVALVAVPALAAEIEIKVQCAGTPAAPALDKPTVEARVGDTIKWTIVGDGAGNLRSCAQGLASVKITSPFTQQPLSMQIPPSGSVSSQAVNIGSAGTHSYKVELFNAQNQPIGQPLTGTVNAKLPTLTEWGLIALAVLLAGGMGYMIYRRRPALRPAAP